MGEWARQIYIIGMDWLYDLNIMVLISLLFNVAVCMQTSSWVNPKLSTNFQKDPQTLGKRMRKMRKGGQDLGTGMEGKKKILKVTEKLAKTDVLALEKRLPFDLAKGIHNRSYLLDVYACIKLNSRRIFLQKIEGGGVGICLP